MSSNTLTALSSLVVLAGLFFYAITLLKRSVKDAENSDLTYLRRVQELRESSDAGKAFPCIITSTSISKLYTSRVGSYAMPYITYIRNGVLKFEQVYYMGTPEKQFSKMGPEVPVEELYILSEFSQDFGERSSVEIRWIPKNSDKPKWFFYINKHTLINQELDKNSKPISGRIHSNTNNQMIITDELLQHGAHLSKV